MKKRQPEQDLKRAIVAHLKARPAPAIFWTQVPNGGWRSPVEAAIFKAMGVRAGKPDLLLCKAGRLCCIELKRPGGKLSEAQQQTITALKQAGAVVAVCDTLDAALDHLEHWGILRGHRQ